MVSSLSSWLGNVVKLIFMPKRPHWSLSSWAVAVFIAESLVDNLSSKPVLF